MELPRGETHRDEAHLDEISITIALPTEIVGMILAWVGPRSLKRFGATCLAYSQLTEWCLSTPEYGKSLVRSARYCLKKRLLLEHHACNGGYNSELDASSEKFAGLVAMMLSTSGCRDSATWAPSHVLHFLYPMATIAYYDWPLAPYALEWCALFERKILAKGNNHTPRREILALLYDDAIARLALIAKESGWDMGITLTAAAAAMCSTITEDTAGIICEALAKLGLSILSRVKDQADAADVHQVDGVSCVHLGPDFAPNVRQVYESQALTEISECTLPELRRTSLLRESRIARLEAGPLEEERTLLCVSTMAAVSCHLAPYLTAKKCPHWASRGAWAYLCGMELSDMSSAPVAWLRLAGLSKNYTRSPNSLLSAFDCRTGKFCYARMLLYDKGILHDCAVPAELLMEMLARAIGEPEAEDGNAPPVDENEDQLAEQPPEPENDDAPPA
jgi:hypothetical protein